MFRAFDPFRGLALTNAVHHRTDPDLRPPSGTLLCTGHGIFLWPGSPLLAKRGDRFADNAVPIRDGRKYRIIKVAK